MRAGEHVDGAVMKLIGIDLQSAMNRLILAQELIEAERGCLSDHPANHERIENLGEMSGRVDLAIAALEPMLKE